MDETIPPRASATETRVLRLGWAVLGGASAALVGWVLLTSGAAGLAELATAAGVSIGVVGKLVIFWGLRAGPLSIWALALMTFLIDLVFAFAMASGLVGLERSRVVGGWLRRSRARTGELLLEYPGLKRWAFLGVIAFVLLPLAGTGAITGSILARLLGLSRLTGIAAVACASAWAAGSFALLATFVGQQAETLLRDPWTIASILALAAVAGWIGYRRVLAELRREA